MSVICTREAGHSGPCNGFPRLLGIAKLSSSTEANVYCRPLVVEVVPAGRSFLAKLLVQRDTTIRELQEQLKARILEATRDREALDQLREDHEAALTTIERLQRTLRAERAKPDIRFTLCERCGTVSSVQNL